MAMPYYVSPEQLMKDKADYARKGIGRGKSVLILEYADGVLFLAENTSATLHKISEIYDRIAFAGVGKFNEFEQLRIGGIRLSDLKGYSYSRLDVTAKALANAYSQTLGTIFTSEVKPYECEILVAAVGDDTGRNEIFHILYDGSVTDRQRWVGLGGQAEAIEAHLEANYPKDYPADIPDFATALNLAVGALRAAGERELTPATLEAAVLDRNRNRRKFRRLDEQELSELF
ncbi:MAG: proteasome subunit alpha [Actinomycetota bacterium]|jgi:proteasome alpha subunit